MVSRKRRPVEDPPPTLAPKEGNDGKGGQEDESEPSSCAPSPSQFTIRPIIRPKPGPEKSAKGKKKAMGDDDEDDNNIPLLKEMARIRAETGSDPSSDPRVLEEMAKGAGVSREEAVEKVKRLKRKFFKNVDKGWEGKSSKKPRDVEAFQLSAKVWGPPIPESEHEPPRGGNVGGGEKGGVVLGLAAAAAVVGVRSASRRPKRAGNARKGRLVVKEEEEEDFLVRELVVAEEEAKKVSWKEDFPVLAGCLEVECGDYLGEGGVRALEEWMVGNVGKGKMNEWEGKWSELKKEELRLFLRRKDLISEQVKFVVDGIKSSQQVDY